MRIINNYSFLLKNFFLIICYFILGIGLYYNNAKFHIPWFGANDYANYSQMVENPFESKVGSPWGYRILTPQVSNIFTKLNIYYEPKESPYKEHYAEYAGIAHTSTLYPLIFTNYVFIVLAAYVIFKSVEKLYLTPFQLVFLHGIVGLFFLSFSTIIHGLSGLTEGGSIFFIAILNYFLLNNKRLYFLIFIVLSIFQRELIPVIMFFYICITGYKKRYWYLASCLIAFVAYLMFRKIYPLSGFENQLDFFRSMEILVNYKFTLEFFKIVIASLNLPIFLIIILFLSGVRKFNFLYSTLFLYLLFLPFCISMGIGINAGRILNILIPLFFVDFLRGIPKFYNLRFV